MPILKRYTDKYGFYIHGAYSQDGERQHSTYQITNSGVAILWKYGVRDNEEIPRDLFFQLLDSGDIYTGESSANLIANKNFPSSCGMPDNVFDGLSNSCRNLIVSLIVGHPTAKTKFEFEGQNYKIHTEGVPQWYLDILIKIAHLPNGEEFLNDLCAAAVNREMGIRSQQR